MIIKIIKSQIPLIALFLAACADSDQHYVCDFDASDSRPSDAFRSSLFFDQEIVILHTKGSSLRLGAKNGFKWSDYDYDKANSPGFASAGKLNSPFGYARFWFSTGKLWINLTPGTLLSYQCREFQP